MAKKIIVSRLVCPFCMHRFDVEKPLTELYEEVYRHLLSHSRFVKKMMCIEGRIFSMVFGDGKHVVIYRIRYRVKDGWITLSNHL